MMKMNFLIVLLVMCRAVKMAPNLLEFRNAGSLDINNCSNIGEMYLNDDPLHVAARSGNLEAVKCFLKNGINVNAENRLKETPLHKAVGQLGVFEFLIESGANVNAGDSHNRSPLHKASSSGNTDAVRILLKYGADVNAEDKSKWKPLHYATIHDNTEIIKILLDHGAFVNAEDVDKNTALHLAGVAGNIINIKLLIENYCANVSVRNGEDKTPSRVALQNGHVEAAQYLTEIERKPDVNTSIMECLKKYEKYGNYVAARSDLIKYLIDHGAIKFNNINNKNSVNISNHNKTNVNVKDVGRKTTVYHAPGDHTDAEIDVNSNATTKPVEYALYWNNINAIQCLLRYKTRFFNAVDKRKIQPIHYSALWGNTEAVKCLINHGADVNAEDFKKWTPIFYAIGHVDTINALIDAGAILNAVDGHRKTPLNYAIENGDVRTIKALVERGAIFNNFQANVTLPTASITLENGNFAPNKTSYFENEKETGTSSSDFWKIIRLTIGIF